MTFLNGILAFGAIAALVPLLIHIFNRSRFKVVAWGAIHLLESVLRKNRRQIQLEQLILLLIRCAIPILFAFALARMVVTEWGPFLNRIILPLVALGFLILVALLPRTKIIWSILCACTLLYILGAETGIIPNPSSGESVRALSGDVPSSTVLLLDDSFSMNANNGFTHARTFSTSFLEGLGKGSEASVIRMGGNPTPLFAKPTSETEILAQRTSLLKAESDRIPLIEALEDALGVVHSGKNPKKEIILLTDFRKVDWDRLDLNALSSFKEKMGQETIPPVLTIIDVGESENQNVSIEEIELSATSIGVGQKIKIRANLRNWSDKNYEGDLMARLFVNESDTPIDEALLSLSPKETTQVLFTHHFEEVGSHVVSVELSVIDDLPNDNYRSASVNVIDRVGALLIDGDPSKEWLRGETDFLKLALTPFMEAETKKVVETKDLIDARVLNAQSFNPNNDLKDQSLVILANVEKLSKESTESIEGFIREGGGLWICAGDQMDLNWYNQELGSSGAGILPMPIIAEKKKVTQNNIRSRIVSSFFDHPALSLFNDPRNGSLADAEIQNWVQLDQTGSAREKDITIIARLETGDPLIIEKKVGKGVVLFLSTSIDTDWTNLPARSCYLPLVQQLASYLADQVTPPRNLSSGSNISHYLPEDRSGEKFQLQLPNGQMRNLVSKTIGEKIIVEFPETRLPGMYQLKSESNEIVHFSVGSSPSESQLEKLSKKEIKEKTAEFAGIVDIIDGTKNDAFSTYQKLDRERTFGRETWKILLGAVLALILLEIILQRSFGKIVR